MEKAREKKVFKAPEVLEERLAPQWIFVNLRTGQVVQGGGVTATSNR